MKLTILFSLLMFFSAGARCAPVNPVNQPHVLDLTEFAQAVNRIIYPITGSSVDLQEGVNCLHEIAASWNCKNYHFWIAELYSERILSGLNGNLRSRISASYLFLKFSIGLLHFARTLFTDDSPTERMLFSKLRIPMMTMDDYRTTVREIIVLLDYNVLVREDEWQHIMSCA